MKKYTHLAGFAALMIFIISASACKKDQTSQGEMNVDCDTIISYESDIRQTIQQSCNTTGCHSAASNSAGYNFETYESVSTNADIILSVIRHDPGVVAMPIGDKLSDEYIENFYCWIEQGKQNN
jgi:hypothetical protein